jgi:hypothetical protein
VGSETLQENESTESIDNRETLGDFSAEDMNVARETHGSEYNDRLQEAREKAEQFFGGKEFSYTHNGGTTYSGTAAQIIDACPHAQTIAGEDGFEAFASFIAPHEKKQDTEESDDGDEKVADDAAATAPVAKVPTAGDSMAVKTIASPQETLVIEKAVDSGVVTPIKNVADAGPAVVSTEPSAAEKLIVPSGEVTKSEAPATVAEESFVEAKPVEPIPTRLDEAVGIPVIVEMTEQEEKSRAIKDAQIEVLSFYEEELVLLVEVTTEMTVDSDEEAEAEVEVEGQTSPARELESELEEDVNIYDFESLLEQVDVSAFEALLMSEDDGPVRTYADMYELVQDHQDIPVEIVFANLLDIYADDALEGMEGENNVHSILTSSERVFTKTEFTEAILRLRIELAYADIDEQTTFEQLQATLQEQLLDLLYRLGYDDPSKAMLELVERHGLGYLLYFISQVGTSVERTTRPHTVTLARKKRRQPSNYRLIPARMAQFVIDSLQGAKLAFNL